MPDPSPYEQFLAKLQEAAQIAEEIPDLHEAVSRRLEDTQVLAEAQYQKHTKVQTSPPDDRFPQDELLVEAIFRAPSLLSTSHLRRALGEYEPETPAFQEAVRRAFPIEIQEALSDARLTQDAQERPADRARVSALRTALFRSLLQSQEADE